MDAGKESKISRKELSRENKPTPRLNSDQFDRLLKLLESPEQVERLISALTIHKRSEDEAERRDSGLRWDSMAIAEFNNAVNDYIISLRHNAAVIARELDASTITDSDVREARRRVVMATTAKEKSITVDIISMLFASVGGAMFTLGLQASNLSNIAVGVLLIVLSIICRKTPLAYSK